MTLLLVAAGAAIGAPTRYLLDRAVQSRHDSIFPWGTFLINLTGSCVLGFVFGGVTTHAIPNAMAAMVGTGLCGALTTYSTFSYETLRLFEEHSRFYAVVNVVGSVVAGLGAALIGVTLATAIWG